jgi:hypothetical protein
LYGHYMSAALPDRSPRVLRSKNWMLGLITAIAIGFGAATVSSYSESGWTWPTPGLAGFSVLGVVALIEQGTARIVISREGIESRTFWSRRLYPAHEVTAVAPLGGFLLIVLAGGKWAKMPGLGQDPAQLAETVRRLLDLKPEE